MPKSVYRVKWEVFGTFFDEVKKCVGVLVYKKADLPRWMRQVCPGLKKATCFRKSLFMAEQEGFEPSVPFWGTHDFQSCSL